ncbi:hypothetical protein [Streptomonospora litoralis]|uniref:Uncharacterized protein n=1 Tax=Streptomonospora litoralis TaxID=2498135 RepID=A0A4P6PZ53_9ACTN|nr:hypothetical protein [Streptomonospora litoralis]QBI53413.1 hypothetical protein EKD16_08095 [Streptomonospora litoralis]
MRHWFGRSHAGWVMQEGEEVTESGEVVGYTPLLLPGVTVTMWDAQTGGSQYTDLLDADGAAVTSVESDEHGTIPRFRGPDGVAYLWASASADGTEPRYIMASPTISDEVATLQERAGDTWRFSAPEVATGSAHRAYNMTGRALEVQWIHASAGVAPASEAVEVDVLLNGVTSLTSSPISIATGANTSSKTTSFDTSEIADGEYLTVEVTGDADAAALTVEIRVA